VDSASSGVSIFCRQNKETPEEAPHKKPPLKKATLQKQTMKRTTFI